MTALQEGAEYHASREDLRKDRAASSFFIRDCGYVYLFFINFFFDINMLFTLINYKF